MTLTITDINADAANALRDANIDTMSRDTARKVYRAVYGKSAPRGATYGTTWLRCALAIARDLTSPARRAKGTGRPLVVAYLTDASDTIGGISAALGVHPRTVRAAILYGKGEGTFEVVGMGGSKGTAKVWAFRPTTSA